MIYRVKLYKGAKLVKVINGIWGIDEATDLDHYYSVQGFDVVIEPDTYAYMQRSAMNANLPSSPTG